MADVPKLIRVFEDAKLLLSRSDNSFLYSGWEDAAEANAEMDQVLGYLREGKVAAVSAIYFLPTGPLQEVNISSGWGDEFLALADRYDAAMAAPNDRMCSCQGEASRDLELVRDFGMDEDFAEVSVLRCPLCGQLWLRYFYENEAFTGSGRWYLGHVANAPVEASAARAMFGDMAWYFSGGSYFGGEVSKRSGPLGRPS